MPIKDWGTAGKAELWQAGLVAETLTTCCSTPPCKSSMASSMDALNLVLPQSSMDGGTEIFFTPIRLVQEDSIIAAVCLIGTVIMYSTVTVLAHKFRV